MNFLKKLFGKSERASAAASPVGAGLDFSHVTSTEKAQALAQTGELTAIYLHPLELGGMEVGLNKVYVPPSVLPAQQDIINHVLALIEKNRVDNINISPEYHGKSFVPARIKMVTLKNGKQGRYCPSIEIW